MRDGLEGGGVCLDEDETADDILVQRDLDEGQEQIKVTRLMSVSKAKVL